ncbi:MAG: hypothetical protein RIC55_14480 [Pirellulaceae bacterium]
MISERHGLAAFLLVAAISLCCRPALHGQDAKDDDSWKKHPALAEPDGRSHRGDKMVAAEIEDPRVLKELSRRFRATRKGFEDFELRQEYLLRLLDYYYFSKRRIVGMKRTEVEEIFGPLGGGPDRAFVSGGRDRFVLWFKDGRVSGAYYAMGL